MLKELKAYRVQGLRFRAWGGMFSVFSSPKLDDAAGSRKAPERRSLCGYAIHLGFRV